MRDHAATVGKASRVGATPGECEIYIVDALGHRTLGKYVERRGPAGVVRVEEGT